MYIPESFIIDNQNLSLFKELKKIISEQGSVDIASGFFNIGGFELICPEILKAEPVRILLGRSLEVDSYDSYDIFDFYKANVKESIGNENFTAINESTTKNLIEFLRKDSVNVRIFTRSFLHGKAYIFPKFVISGSSNFTRSGFTSNTELNTVLGEPEAIYIKENWFNRLWQDSIDFKAELINILERSKFGTITTPYDVFMKALFELQKEDIYWDKDKTPKDIFTPTTKVELAEFQEDATKRVFSRLKKYNGSLVADSVGLGKTFIAKKIIEEFGFYLRRNFLIVCPAQIRESIWVKELKDLGLSENVISQEDLGSGELTEKIKKALGNYEKIKELALIVVDESHNFRNPLSNRYESLFTLIEQATTENNVPKILLLTATPINNTIWDLYHQISLISRNNDKILIKENIPNMKELFRTIERTGNVNLLEDVLHEVSIRRTRQFIREKYPEATIKGEKVRFPDRILKTTNYQLDASYQGLYRNIADKIENELKLAYYNMEDYRISGTVSSLEAGRMIALSGIFKTILLKRLESSVGAFRKSIESQIKFLRKFRDFLNENKVLSKSYYNKYIYAVEDPESKPEEYMEFQQYLVDLDIDIYDKKKLLEGINLDISVFESIYSDIKDIKIEQDAKVNRLKEILIELKDSGKILIFTYYTDTLLYIVDSINNDKNFLSQLGRKFDYIYGAFSPKRRQEIIEKFLNGNVDVLVSTDILSEGQNLQQAKIVINYDLHWNPTRMIQRAGRIDRIGSPFDEIFIYNFFPEDELEELLRLVKTLQIKIFNINESIGLDVSVLGELINPKVFGALSVLKEGTKNEKQMLMDELEREMFGGGEKFWEPLRSFIEKYGKEYLESLPDGIKSGLEKKMGIRGVFFYFKYEDDYNLWMLYDTLSGEIISNKSLIIDFISCQQDEPRVVPEDIDVYEIYKNVREIIISRFRDVQARTALSRDKGSEKMMRDISQELTAIVDEMLMEYAGETATIQSIEDLIDKLDKISFTRGRWKTLRKIWNDYKGKKQNWREFLNTLNSFVQDKKAIIAEKFQEFDEKKLRLVCVDIIT